MPKNSFLLYYDQMLIVEKLTKEQAGDLLNAIVHYAINGIEIDLDPIVSIAFFPIKNHLDRDGEKFSEKIKIRSELGKLGGLAKAKQKLAKASKSQKVVAKLADSVSDSDSDSDSVSDSVSERKDMCRSHSLAENVLDGFDEFYKLYPLKKSRETSKKSWVKNNCYKIKHIIMLSLEGQIKEKVLLMSVRAFTPEWPLPSTWLNQHRWEDEVVAPDAILNTTGDVNNVRRNETPREQNRREYRQFMQELDVAIIEAERRERESKLSECGKSCEN